MLDADVVAVSQTYMEHYNTVRLHSAIGYVTPQDMLAGRQAETLTLGICASAPAFRSIADSKAMFAHASSPRCG